MFLTKFSYPQRKQFLSLALEILSVDGSIDREEEAYLRGLCGEMSLSRSDAVENPQINITTVFEEQEARRIVILELLGPTMSFTRRKLNILKTLRKYSM